MKISIKRTAVQLTFFALFNAALFNVPLLPILVPVLQCFAMPTTVLCNFGVLQRNLSFDWPISPALPLASVAMFVVAGAAFGRAMCAWTCPLGFFQDVLASVSGFLGRKERQLSQKLHFMLNSAKYMLLFATLAVVLSVGVAYAFSWLLGKKYSFSLGICGRAPYCVICPVPALFVTLPSLLNASLLGTPLPELSLSFYISFAVVAFLVAASIYQKRSWCRYICPVGALMSFFNRFSFLHIGKRADKCTAFCRGHSKECNKSCPMEVGVSRNRDPSADPECTLCYNCAESCPNKAIKFELG